ncbi:MAG: hypothetical protein OEW18_02020 [Candidatus Aminicenantes bacterium]|nr:hypothetical protein [Candidatus Aminicenantes bacterium]
MKKTMLCLAVLLLLFGILALFQEASQQDKSLIGIEWAKRAKVLYLSKIGGRPDAVSPKDPQEALLILKLNKIPDVDMNKVKISVRGGENTYEVGFRKVIWEIGKEGTSFSYFLVFSVLESVLEFSLCIGDYLPQAFKAEKEILDKLEL